MSCENSNKFADIPHRYLGTLPKDRDFIPEILKLLLKSKKQWWIVVKTDIRFFLDPNSQFLTHWLLWVALMTGRPQKWRNFFFHSFELVVNHLVMILIPETSDKMTLFRLLFVEIDGKWFCLIWGIYARFAKKMAGLTLHNSFFH